MSSHDAGSVYRDWKKAERGITKLEQDIASEQVRHISLEQYQPGSPHYESLMAAVKRQNAYEWPAHLTINV